MTKKEKEKIYDLIIIGGGPAGMTAGIYAARKKMDTLLITKDFLGQTAKTGEVDNYLGFPEIEGGVLMKKFEDHLKKFDIKTIEGKEITKVSKKGLFIVETSEKDRFESRTVIVASGRDPRPLEVPGEKEFIGKGVSYCSICDAPLFQNKKTVVVGGGNAGFEAALDLAQYAQSVYIFERGETVTADELLQERVAANEKIEVQVNKIMKKIEGDNFVHSLFYQDSKTKRNFQIPVHGIFIQIGSVPATGFLKDLCDFNKRDEVVVDFESCATTCPGLFAAGDINDGRWKQVIIAAGEGSRAALSAHDYLRKYKD
jgi:NADH-dependent peroxiredoxin subunit F